MAVEQSCRASALAGEGNPNVEKMVDSKATTALPVDNAVLTSSPTTITWASLVTTACQPCDILARLLLLCERV